MDVTLLYIKHERLCLTTIPNTENRVENTTHSGAYSTNFFLKLFNNSSGLKKEIMTVLVFGYLIFISIDFYD